MIDGDTDVSNGPVAVTVSDGTAVVTLHRPEVRNAVDGEMLEALGAAFTALAADESVRAMVLRGAGQAFCAGADVTDEYYEAGPAVRATRVDLGYRTAAQMRELPFPTVCAINGSCVAIGVSLAALCDLRIASDDARLILGFAQVGILPDLASSSLLADLVGGARALELVLLDDPIPADRALELGLVSSVVPPARLIGEATDLARRLSHRSGAATRLSRNALRDLGALPFAEAISREKELVKERIGSRDLREGLAAVRDRRAPQFTDR